MTDLINLLIKKGKKINVFPLHEKWLDYGLKKNINKHLTKKKIINIMKFHALICARSGSKGIKIRI